MAHWIQKLLEKDKWLVVGMISGTSADGVDAALCEISGSPDDGLQLNLVDFYSEPYSTELQRRVLDVSKNKASTEDICRLNFRIGQTFARAARRIIKVNDLKPADVDLVGSHGQTVCHLPPRIDAGIGATGIIQKTGSTLQLGEPSMIAEALEIPVVFNFRPRDMAAGGQGAPLVTYVDWLLYVEQKKTRLLINIGGISNMTYIPADALSKEVLAFDSGPGNMIVDALIQRMSGGREKYDADGAMAAKGKVDGYILSELLQHPYLSRSLPKSTGREEFGEEYANHIFEWGIRRAVKPSDILRTCTDFTAITLAEAYKKFLEPKGKIDEIIVSGGGTRNPVLMNRMRREFGDAPLLMSTDVGMPADAKDAVAFAVLARECILNRPGNLPRTTGATGPKVLGQICPP